METLYCQRWRRGKPRYRPAGEVIDTRLYDVEPIPGDQKARAFIQEHHYLKSYPAARRRFGLYHRGTLVGVAVYSHPVNDKTLAVFPGEPKESLELGRLVLADSVPANGESWFIARCFDALRKEGFIGVASFCDPLPRLGMRGEVVFKGHIGVIYQAMNAVYLGRSKPGMINVLPDGSVMHRRSIQKIRGMEQGWEAAVRRLVQFGAPSPEGDIRKWLDAALAAVSRPVRHPGNHKYAWILGRRWRRLLPPSLSYPKAAPIHPSLF